MELPEQPSGGQSITPKQLKQALSVIASLAASFTPKLPALSSFQGQTWQHLALNYPEINGVVFNTELLALFDNHAELQTPFHEEADSVASSTELTA
ncbi:hypothetical protein KOW79_004899 [Hemibagrus wyckioides]|uniref:Uncharacterized protein n=1 Tax=Hemibagrus wyckioides TaxID=337641 RepID=A0A9D3P0Z2_9TELE|nr:hypothetical protein KOW79_004899 [Hemibagrus wyckioides]